MIVIFVTYFSKKKIFSHFFRSQNRPSCNFFIFDILFFANVCITNMPGFNFQ